MYIDSRKSCLPSVLYGDGFFFNNKIVCITLLHHMNRSNGNYDRVAVVTGSSRGIGKAIAREFVQNDYCVVLNSRDEEDLTRATHDIAKEIRNDQRIHYVAGDVSQENICKSLIQAAVKKFGRLDVLVNNAGISVDPKKIKQISTSDWSYVIDVNLKGAFLCTREALNHMLHNSDIAGSHAKNNYSIINISSVHESIPQPDAAHYAASKGGMEMLTKNTAMEVADKGIRVNGIAPGAIATDMNRDLLEDEGRRKEKEQTIPLRRIGNPEEIAKVALFLASSDASYITGTTIYVDGGLTLTS
jgi:glucose 1-dehydrogenase